MTDTAVTREGFPVRVWSWPGNTADSAPHPPGEGGPPGLDLTRIVWVANRGFSSAENRRYLRRGDHHYIIGGKLRSGSGASKAALFRPLRYQEVALKPRVKQVKIARSR